MKSIVTRTGLTLALAGALGVVTFAQTPTPQAGTPQRTSVGRFERRGQRGDRRAKFEHKFERHAFKQLNLSDAQHQQMRATRERYQQSFQTQRQELRQLAETRRNGGTLTAEQQARAKELHAQLRANREKMHAEVLGTLTTEQRDQLKQQREQIKERMKERRAGRPDLQPGPATPPVNN
ncbi:MAG: Spy/CpxP family protein refolding chaperone [Pyrinomonadaceae bacterium]